MSFTASSQSLKPKVRLENKDTLFCFTIQQSKAIAKHLENSRYCDSVLVQTENQVELLNQLQAFNDSSLLIMKMKTENQLTMIQNQEAVVGDLNLKLSQTEKKFKNERWQKRLFAAGFFVMAIVAVIK
ncbi:MAG TPA: hypothetical protein VLB84_13820 [Bacteroidia bacterium]|nr:hypothetical protein [Bacteroidia bacterium]